MSRGLLVFLVLALLFGAPYAHAQQPAQGTVTAPAGVTPAEARHVIETLQDPQKRAQLIESLRVIAKTAPAPGSAAGGPVPAAAPAAPAPGSPAAATAVSLAPDSLGAQLLSQLSAWPERVRRQAVAAAGTLTNSPLLWIWLRGIADDPYQRMAVINALWQAALVVGCGLFAGWLARRGLARPLAAVAAQAPDGSNGPNDSDTEVETATTATHRNGWRLLRRLPYALLRLVLELIPVGVFWGSAMLLSSLLPFLLTRAAIAIVVDAYAIVRIVMSIARMLVSPAKGRLRLIEIDDAQAEYLISWLRAIAGVAVFGQAIADLALLFGLYEDAYDTLMRLVALIVAVLAGTLVLRSRRTVAARLRAAEDADGGLAHWRNGLAAIWHLLALVLIAAGWIVASAGVREGLSGLRLLIGSVLILIGARLAAVVVLALIDRGVRLAGPPGQTDPGVHVLRYQQAARAVVSIAIGIATLIMLLDFWGLGVLAWFERGRIGASIVSALITVGVALVAAVVVWEIANTALERRLARLSAAGSAGHLARMRTLMPIVRAALLTTIAVIVGLTALSEVGVNIAPLLAGAGIAGVAVGFGAQKLVQDVITGMFVLFENAIQIGDKVTVASLTGTVERLSIRNIWLRGDDGAVHIVPFSADTSITNANRGLGNAAVSVTVGYLDNVDEVMQVLTKIGADLRADSGFADSMLGDLKLWVDSVKANGVAISGSIPCTDSGRWPVQHEFYRRLEKRFRELGITLATG